MKFVYSPFSPRHAKGRAGAPVRWYATPDGDHDYHASLDGIHTLCSVRVRLLLVDPRPDPPSDPSRDPWTCPTCQERVRRVPSKKPVPVEVLNRALTRALIGSV